MRENWLEGRMAILLNLPRYSRDAHETPWQPGLYSAPIALARLYNGWNPRTVEHVLGAASATQAAKQALGKRGVMPDSHSSLMWGRDDGGPIKVRMVARVEKFPPTRT